eukprot:TRINITY_DN13330_c0_g1_i1.p1 TRINITY_DN13330_c0_g1~~TRINITY_DN13330_c0_g1_i1.p1  ORF type:complete len:268 (+),score=20.90 TRINITY_DN13330_c0_g1_i1:38-841(+)
MKVTLTEKGLDVYRRLKPQHVHIHPPSSQLQRPFAISQKKPLTALLQTKSDPGEVLSALLPAVISFNPPQEIAVRKTHVSVSEAFKSKYASPLRFTFERTSPSKTIHLLDKQPIKEATLNLKGVTLKTLCNTYGKPGFSKFPQANQIEFTANNIIATTLKSNRVKELQLEEARKRSELELQRQTYMSKEKVRINSLLDENIRELEDKKLLRVVSARLEGNRARHTDRMAKVHDLVTDQWQKKQRTIRLSRNVERRSSVPFYKLINKS